MAPEEPAGPPRKRPRFRTTRVASVEEINPYLTRVILSGEELDGFALEKAAHHMKLIFPKPGSRNVELPGLGPDGRPMFPPDERPLMRTFTPRRFDSKTLEMEVEFALHSGGMATNWVTAARPGDTIVVAGPGGGHVVDTTAASYLIAGDESALPAIGTLLELLPRTTEAEVLIEVRNAGEEHALPAHSAARVRWLHREPDESVAGRKLAAAVREATLKADGLRAWVGCESTAMRAIRQHLIFDRGLERQQLDTRGYWKYGVENNPDGDKGEEI